jgi:hypothetical protein
MTEAEWLQCTDSQKMLEFVQGKVSDRKLRLFACACCRTFWSFLTDIRSREAVEASELFADNLIRRGELRRAAGRASNVLNLRYSPRLQLARSTANVPAAALADLRWLVKNEVAIVLLHDIFGTPFRPALIDPQGLTPTVTSLAAAAYEGRSLPSGELDPARFAVLADALEEAGCQDQSILDHLRSPGPHVRGCWPLDLILGRA